MDRARGKEEMGKREKEEERKRKKRETERVKSGKDVGFSSHPCPSPLRVPSALM